MRSRMVTLMLAVLTGAVAVAIVYFYVQRVEEQTTRGQEAVPVLVAGQSLPAGTTWADIVGSQLAEQQNIPERYVAPGALGGFQDLSRGVLAREVVAGEQLTSQAFAADAQTAFGSQFKAGTQVLSLPVERARAVAGHLAPGSHVNAFETSDQGGTHLIARHVEVVEMQPAAEGDPAGLEEMVLEVTQTQAVDLIRAHENASLWFTLIPQRGPS